MLNNNQMTYKIFLGLVMIAMTSWLSGCKDNEKLDTQFKVTTQMNEGGRVDIESVLVNAQDIVTINITPNTGYVVKSVDGCDGVLTGLTYTTAPVTRSCKVRVTFQTETILASAQVEGSGGKIDPARQEVKRGETTEFKVTPEAGFEVASITGCQGQLSKDIYTTGKLYGACFSINFCCVLQ